MWLEEGRAGRGLLGATGVIAEISHAYMPVQYTQAEVNGSSFVLFGVRGTSSRPQGSFLIGKKITGIIRGE